MVRKLVYRCDPESLRGGVTEAEFVDAFEAQVYAVPRLREAAVEVRFETCLYSGLVSVSDDEAGDHDPLTDDLRDLADTLARKAWDACLNNAGA